MDVGRICQSIMSCIKANNKYVKNYKPKET